MVEVLIKYNDEEYDRVSDFLLDIAYRQHYRDALFEITHNLWRVWKHDESNLSVDSLKVEISKILDDFGLDYKDFER